MPRENKYSPTENPGDTRPRVCDIHIKNVLRQVQTLAITEETVMRDAAGVEQVILLQEDPRRMQFAYDPALVLQVRNKSNDALVGRTICLSDLYDEIYTLCRHIQELADARAQ